MKKTLRMKFMLLLFALVAGIGNAWADDPVTISASDQGLSNGGTFTTINSTHFSLTFAQNNSTNPVKYYNNSFRFYKISKDGSKGASVTVAASEGYLVTAVTLTSGGSKFTASTGSYSNGNWTGAANSVELSHTSTSGSTDVSSIVVTVTATGGNPTYTLTITDPTGGTITVLDSESNEVSSGDKFEAGEELEIEADASTGYTFTAWTGTTSAYASTSSASTTFTMPATAATIAATFTLNTHSLSLTSSNGTCFTTINGVTWDGSSKVPYGAAVVVTATPSSDYQFSSWTCSYNTVTENGNEISFTMPDEDVTLTATYSVIPTYTAKFSVNGTIDNANNCTVAQGAAITFPSNPSDINGNKFVGWTTATISGTTNTAPTPLVTSATMGNSDVTFYACFAVAGSSSTPSLTKMTSSDTFAAGDKVVIVAVVDNENVAMYQETVNSSYVNKYSFDNNAATVAADDKKWFAVSAGTNGTWKLGDETNGYLYTSGSNNLEISTSNSTNFNLAWNSNNNGFTLQGNSRYLSCRSDLTGTNHNYFRLGGTSLGTGTNYFDIYKYETGSISYSNYCTTVVISTVATPQFNPTLETFNTASLSVELSCETEGATIRYTTNGEEPDSNSDEYSSEISIYATTTIKAKAFKDDDESALATKTYTKIYNVTLSSNGVAGDPIEVTSGQTTTLTAPSNIPAGYNFRGWTDTPESPSTLVSTQYGPTDNVTLYAVFGKNTYGDFVKVTSAPSDWSGYYLIVYETGSVALNGGINSSSYDVTNNGISVTITTGGDSKKRIEANSTTTAAMFIIEKYNTAYSLKSAAGYYIGRASNSTGINADASNVYTNTFDISSDNAVISASNGYVLRYNASTGQDRFRYYSGSSVEAIQIYQREVTSTDGNYTRVYPSNVTATANINVSESGPMLIESGSILDMGSYTLTCDDPTKLIIEDGGQLKINNNATVAATIKKSTAASSSTKIANNLYAIASPVEDIEISTFAQGTHNVYRYDGPTSVWQEYRNVDNKFDDLEIGRGYLYRSSVAGIDLAGEVTGGDASGEVSYSLSYNGSGAEKFRGLNLVGNPFTHNITWSNLDLTKVETGGCYVLNEDPEDKNHGKWQAVMSESVTVKPMQAFFVQATAGSASITFKNTAGGGGKALNYANDNIMLSVKNGKCSDEAYVLFKEGHGLNKIEHRNAEIPMLYVMDNGQNFAIADMSDDTRAINLGFEAKTIGQYTISLKAEGQYGHMSLYDKVTNTETDMLLEDSYTFVGAPNDRKDRFVLNLNYNAANINTDSDIFAYQSGSDIIIRGDGELHVFDVMGRLVLTQRVNGVETISMQSQGVYIFKLNGMTQKIVVR